MIRAVLICLAVLTLTTVSIVILGWRTWHNKPPVSPHAICDRMRDHNAWEPGSTIRVDLGPVRPLRRIGPRGIGPRIEHIPQPECPDCRHHRRRRDKPCLIHAKPRLDDDLHLLDAAMRAHLAGVWRHDGRPR